MLALPLLLVQIYVRHCITILLSALQLTTALAFGFVLAASDYNPGVLSPSQIAEVSSLHATNWERADAAADSQLVGAISLVT